MSRSNIDPGKYDLTFLNRELDRTKVQTFLGTNAAFLGALTCSLTFHWTTEIPTAATNGDKVWWNPDFFLALKPEVRKTVLLHELWHVAKLHMLRLGDRVPKIWNWACDIHINNQLKREGHSFESIEWVWMDPSYGDMVEEEIYKDLILKNKQPPQLPKEFCDIEMPEPEQRNICIHNVSRAVQASKVAGGAGAGRGTEVIEKYLDKFLQPVVPWEATLYGLFTDLERAGINWGRPNRRFPHVHMPSRQLRHSKLAKLNYYLDISGSTSDRDVLRFNSELKYIKDVFNPAELKHIQFTDRIVKEFIINEHEEFNTPVRAGYGGTWLAPVHDHIVKDQPTAAIIFTDLDCEPMEPLPFDIPIIWVVTGNRYHTPEFGTILHIPEVEQ